MGKVVVTWESAEIYEYQKSSTVEVYQDLFEALMNIGESSESYAISLCIGGLKDEIGMPVRMFKPASLINVYCLEKMQKATIDVSKNWNTPLLQN
ncbi:hypothetical protein Tco_0950433 [Tanacetum coccineum]